MAAPSVVVDAPKQEIEAVSTSPALDVADLAMNTRAREIELAKPTSAPQSLPTMLRMVSPDYPDNGSGASHVKVGFEFAIDRDGKVHNINVVSGSMHSGFAEAARRALRQWRFDPGSLQARAGEKYRQDFEFVSGTRPSDGDDDHCTPPTGSHVCRPSRSVSVTMKVDPERATAQHTVALAAGGSN